MRRIVSLTSIPPRFGHLARTLRSLVAQGDAVDAIELYLPDVPARFGASDPPADLPGGVEVIPVAEDFGPATKLLHAARRHRGTGAQIVICDDDHVYGPGWARCLFETQAARPGEAVTLRARRLDEIMGPVPGYVPPGPYAQMHRRGSDRRSDLRRTLQKLAQFVTLGRVPGAPMRGASVAGYSDILFGFCGSCLHVDMVDDPFFDLVAPFQMVDDVWFSGHLARRGIPIWVPAEAPIPREAAAAGIASLLTSSVGEMGRGDLNAAAIRHFQTTYGVWGGAGRRADGLPSGGGRAPSGE